MAGIILNQGQQIRLANHVNKTAPQNLVLRLFKNNHTPVAADTEANFTEADFSGYAAITLTGASWTVSGGSPAIAAYAKQTFVSNAGQAPQIVYGWYLTQVVSGLAVGAGLFNDNNGNPITYTITNNLDEIDVTPSLTENNA